MQPKKKPSPAPAAPRRRRAAVTSVDVAREAGVSQSVVSRAFSLHSSVAEQTRADIFKVAARLGYRPNLLARSLITRKTHLFALVTGALANPLLLNIIETFTQAAQRHGYRVLLFTSLPGQDLDTALVDVLQYQPDGIIVLAGTPSEALSADCLGNGIPVVLLGRESHDPLVPCVSCDNFAAGASVAQFLVQAGYRRFAFVTSQDPTLSFSERRQSGFCETIQRLCGQKPSAVNGGSTYRGGYNAGLDLLRKKQRPDAIFCASDPMACGVIDAARRELSLAVPDDLAVVGFDDVPMAAWESYRLTTVRQPVNEMVQGALSLLLNHETAPARRSPAAKKRTAVKATLLPGELVLRSSAKMPA